MKWLLFLTFILFNYAGLCQDNAELIDSLKRVAESNVHDTSRIKAYYAWDNLIYYEDPELDMKINLEVLDIVDENIALQNESPEVLKYYYGCKAKSTNIVGLLLSDQGKYLEAQDYLFQSLKIAEALNNKEAMAGPLNNLGTVFKYLDFHEKSLEYYLRAMEMDGEDDWAKSIYLNNMGIVYVEMGKIDLAKYYYKQSLALSKEVGNFYNEANTVANIGEIHYKEKEYDSAITYFVTALEMDRANGIVGSEAYMSNKIGLAYYFLGDFKNSFEYCSQSLKMLESVPSLIHETDCHQCLYVNYFEKGNLEKAIYHFEQYHILEDSLENKEKIDEILRIQYQNEFESKRIADSLEIMSSQKIKEIELQANITSKDKQQKFLYVGIFALLIVGGLTYRSYKNKKRDNEIIAGQKAEVEFQKAMVDEKNHEILDSIAYAKRLQQAILPSREEVDGRFQNFILYRPKDVVSGDFYWSENKNGVKFIAAADCTGHGVPGALVSVVCSNALNRSVNEFKLSSPAAILDKTRELVIETFSKSGEDVKDGMDISLCAISGNTVEFSGANNPLWVLNHKSEDVIEYKADKQPIGKYATAKPFTNHKIELEKGDQIYLFTDGFADQFGGEKGKKLKYKTFKEILVKNSSKSLPEQRQILSDFFKNWKSGYEQIDDVCIIGVRV